MSGWKFHLFSPLLRQASVCKIYYNCPYESVVNRDRLPYFSNDRSRHCAPISLTPLPRPSFTVGNWSAVAPLIAKTLFIQHVDRMYSVLVSDAKLMHHACADMSKLDLLPRVYNSPIQEFITVDSMFAEDSPDTGPRLGVLSNVPGISSSLKTPSNSWWSENGKMGR